MADGVKSTDPQTTIDQDFAPVLSWMKANGIKRFENGGFVLELEDAPKELVRLRTEVGRLNELLIRHGLFQRAPSRYSVPDMPREVVEVAEDDGPYIAG